MLLPPHRPAPVPPLCRATPASAYTCECRLLKAYRAQLYALSCDIEALARRLWGPLSEAQLYGSRKGNPGRVDYLDYNIPDLIRLLRPDEQPPVEALLLAGDLTGTVQWLLALAGHLNYRETKTPPGRNTNATARAAGLGRLAREAYGRPVAPPLPVPQYAAHL